MPEGRMLKKKIATSRKINFVSMAAEILFYRCIAFEDSAGFIEAEPDWLKFNVVPMRKDIPLEMIPDLVRELIEVGAWIPYLSKEGLHLVWDPKFEDEQKNRRKDKEATSPYLDRDEKYTITVIKVDEVSLDDVENWLKTMMKTPLVRDQDGTGTGLLPPKERKKESKVNEKKESREASPLSSKKVKEVLNENPKLNELVHKLRDSKKWAEVGSWLAVVISEVKLVEVEDLIKTLEIIDAKKDFTGDIFGYAAKTLKNIVNEKITQGVEDRAKEMKKEEGDFTAVGEVLGKLKKD